MSHNASLLFHKHMGLQAKIYSYLQAKLLQYLEFLKKPENGQYPSLPLFEFEVM